MTKDLKPCPFCGGTEVKLDCEARNRTGEYVLSTKSDAYRVQLFLMGMHGI